MDRRIAIIGYSAAAVFAIAVALTLIGGIGLADALVWNVLGSLSIVYYTLPRQSAGNVAILIANLLDVFVFALITVLLASVFYDALRNSSMRERRVRKKITALRGHTIIAPYGTFAQALMDRLSGSETRYVVIAKDSNSAARLNGQGVLAIAGEPSSASTLEAAGIARAKYVVACSEKDLENTLIAISAKAANSGIRIISRLAAQENMAKLSRAGTYKLVMPELAAGTAMADALLKKVV